MTEVVDRLRLIPLGGVGEIGRNLMCVECGDDIVVIDAGLMFPESEMLGVDLVIPDVSWLAERRHRLRGVVLTHGHEDHIGCLPYVLPRLECPVYGTALTLGLLRNKLREHRLLDSSELHTVRPGDRVTLGSITVEWIHATHSIPDACALALHTALGVIVHSGDFKLDQTPIQGEPPDLARLARLGDDGVLLLLSDSTNAEAPGMTASERTVGAGLESIVATAAGRVLIATFASNISRLQQAVHISEEHDRRCFVVGRSMLNNVRVAEELGLLHSETGTFVSPKQADRVDDADLCVLCTGAQGEPLSALARIAAGEHPLVALHEGDTVILSANAIPGNEEAVHRTVNNLHRRGAHVFHGSRHGVHASGHASAEELRLLLTLCRPRFFMPVHGEPRHLAAHAVIARNTGVTDDRIVIADNGRIIEIDESGVHVAPDRVAAGYVYVDGLSLEDAADVVFRDRRLLSQDGIIIVMLTRERSTGVIVGGPELVTRGFIENSETERLFEEARDEVRRLLNLLLPDSGWTVAHQAVHEGLEKFLFKRTRRRPLILPLLTEV
ncbi:MAG: ribonuclease J [Candidatus Dormibacteria bacterium]